MTEGQLLVDVINDGVIVAFLAALLFPLIGLRGIRLPRGRYVKIGYWPWWKNEFGWNVIAFDFTVSVALFPAILHRVFGVNVTSYIFGWTEAVSIWLIPATILWRAVAIWHTQSVQRDADNDG